jgi:ADP-ribose pyrophosphatase YjhB (NUDIX family)
MDRFVEQLRAHRAADPFEEAFVYSMLDLASHGASAFARDHFVPGHFTASCFILDPDNERLLLHFHKRYNKWLPVGGHVERGEAPMEAALREGLEESGLTDLELVSEEILCVDVHAIPQARGEPDHQHFDARYLARTKQPEQAVMDPRESRALEWVEIARVPTLMKDRSSERAVARVKALLASDGASVKPGQ